MLGIVSYIDANVTHEKVRRWPKQFYDVLRVSYFIIDRPKIRIDDTKYVTVYFIC